jgi:integrase
VVFTDFQRRTLKILSGSPPGASTVFDPILDTNLDIGSTEAQGVFAATLMDEVHMTRNSKARKAIRIDSAKARKALPLRRSPFYQRLGPGRFVGWRNFTEGSPGNWNAKFHKEGTDLFLRMGALEGWAEEERYEEAFRRATEWFSEIDAEDAATTKVSSKVTLRQVLREYILERDDGTEEMKKKVRWLISRVDSLVLPFKDPAGVEWKDMPLMKITVQQYRDWKTWMKEQPTNYHNKNRPQRARANSTVDRDVNLVRAALNRARRVYGVKDRWTEALALPKSQSHRKTVEARRIKREYITPEDRVIIAEKCATICPELHPLIQAMRTAPIRPGAWSYMTAGSYDKRAHEVHVGRDKANGNRTVSLPDTPEVRKLFADATRNKLPGAPLFVSPLRKRWNSKSWGYHFKKVVKAAGLDPESITMYCLRHSLITDLVNDGQSSAMLIAQIAGTSVAMINEHYFHLRGDKVREVLKAVGF